MPCVQPLSLLHVVNYSCLLSEGWVSGAAGDARVGKAVPGSPAVYKGVGEGRKAVPGRRCLAPEKEGVSDHRGSRGSKANTSCPRAKVNSSSSEQTPPGQRSGQRILQNSFPEVFRAFRQDWGALSSPGLAETCRGIRMGASDLVSPHRIKATRSQRTLRDQPGIHPIYHLKVPLSSTISTAEGVFSHITDRNPAQSGPGKAQGHTAKGLTARAHDGSAPRSHSQPTLGSRQSSREHTGLPAGPYKATIL